jgi:hypothetical protein
MLPKAVTQETPLTFASGDFASSSSENFNFECSFVLLVL